LQPHSVRVFFCGANNTSLFVLLADPEGKYEALEKYGIDLTEMAKQGKLDPVIGRDEEIRRCIQILSRRTKNNPVLIGEPGVGKTAIVEGLVFHLKCLLQIVCRLWNWDMYIRQQLMFLNRAKWNW
jgi:hypothetical protein